MPDAYKGQRPEEWVSVYRVLRFRRDVDTVPGQAGQAIHTAPAGDDLSSPALR